MKRKSPDPKLSILKFLEQQQRKEGHSMAQICRGINCQLNPLYCGRRKCGFPNPRKRKRFTLFNYVCEYPYSSVMRKLKQMERKGLITITPEMRFDKFKSGGALDPRKIVRLRRGEWIW